LKEGEPSVTRTATGRFAETMRRFRSRMAELGLDTYVIGDEIFWDVAREDGLGTTNLPRAHRPLRRHHRLQPL
jgi:hypothetical protein